MPKDEFDPDDPMELCGVGLLTNEDTTDAMAECFIEEFMRLGYSHKHIFALFRNPFYIGMNMVLQNKGEDYVKDKIAEVFARWGKVVNWPDERAVPLTPALSHGERGDDAARCDESETVKMSPAADALCPLPEGEGKGEGERGVQQPESFTQTHEPEFDETATDPTGAPLPKLRL